MAALLPVIFGGLYSKINCIQKWIVLFLLISVLGVLILANSRAAWLAGVVSIVYFFISLDGLKNKILHKNKNSILTSFRNLKYPKSIVIVITVPLLIIAFLKLYEIRPESANGRLLVWKSTAQMISDNPLTGVGTGQFKANYMHYQAEYLQNNYDAKEALLVDNTVFAFNEFICIASELGIPGLFLVLFLLFAIFRKTETDNLSVFIAKSGLMSILVFSLFSYPGSVTSIKVLFVLFIAIVANNQKQLLLPIPITGNSLKGVKIVVVSVSTVLLIVSFRNIKEVTVACHNWKTATETITFNKLEQGIKLYEKAYPFLKTDGFFMGMYGNCLLREENYTEAEKILKAATNLLPVSDTYLSLGDCFRAQKQFNNAEKAYKCALQMVPSRIKPVYKLAELYVQTNRQREAICIIEDYLESEYKKRTIASYEIELNLIELKKEIESFIEK